MQIPIVSWELYTASVILMIALVVVFMLLRFVAILKTLEETQMILYQLLVRVNPRDLLEMDLPPESSAASGGESKN